MRQGAISRRGEAIRVRALGAAVLLAALIAAIGLGGAPPAIGGEPVVQGSSGVGDPLLPKAGNGGYKVSHYDADLRYRLSANKLRATTTIDAKVKTGGQDLGRFDLDFRGPNISSLKVDGKRAVFSRSGQELIVTPESPLEDGSKFSVEVKYAGHPKPVTDDDGSQEGWVRTKEASVALGEPQGTPSWLPSNDHPSDKASFNVRIKVPKGQSAISNGRLAERETKGKWTSFQYRQKEPMTTYLASVAAGHFQLERGKAGGVPYLAAITEGQARNGGAKALLQRTRKALDFERSILGKYPFSTTGGIVVPSSLGYSLEVQTRPYYPGVPSQDLAVHELAHQWFGDSATLSSWNEIWLHEGFATYFEFLYAERHGGPTAQQAFNQLYAAHGAGDDGFWNPPSGDPGTAANIFAGSVYTRGAMALQVIRKQVGGKDFFAILRKWARNKRHANGTIAQFQALAESVSGEDLDTIFQDWLYEPGKPPLDGPRGKAAVAPLALTLSGR